MDVAGLNVATAAAVVGEVSPSECWQSLSHQEDAQLVDVRTQPEWMFAGYPDLSPLGKRAVLLSWRLYPDYEMNPGFITELASRIPDKETPIYFLCKVGGRSAEAADAMLAQGYTQCFNVKSGFEGEPDEARHRGRVNGWKAEELPWVQA